MAGPTRAGLRTLVASAPATRTWRVGLEPKHEDADLGTLIDELLERLEPEAAERVQVEISSGADLTGCWDPDLLERVIANLVSNALKYSPPASPRQSEPSQDAVKLSLTDHGIGISEDELPQLFSR